MTMDYLTIHEAAEILKAHTNTVYKMCRQGVLPAVKIGKEWRIHSEKFAEFMERGVFARTEVRPHDSLKEMLQNGHVLGLFADPQDIWEFEKSFFLSAPKAGYRLLKACWWQEPDEVRAQLMAAGLSISELERQGSLVILDLARIFETSGPVAAAGAWFKSIIEALDSGYKGVFGCGSPHFGCCGSSQNLMEFERALDQMLKGLPVTGICSYTLPTDHSRDLNIVLNLMETHDRFFIRTNEKEVFAQITRVVPGSSLHKHGR